MSLLVRATRRAPARAGRLAPFAVAVLASLPLGSRASAQPTDLDKLIPADALVYLAVDGMKPLQTALTEFLDGVMPGQGGAMAGMAFMQMQSQPGMGEIDPNKPVYFAFLASEQPVFILPLANPADFEALVKTQPGNEKMSLVPGQGYSLFSPDGPIDLDSLKKGASPKTPLLQGPVRGFVDLPRLLEKYGQQIDEALGMMAAMSGEASGGRTTAILEAVKSSATRVDFGVTPSKAGLELAFSSTPMNDGFFATIAKAPAPSSAGLDKLLAALPADTVMAGSLSTPQGALKGLVSLLGLDAATQQKLSAVVDKMNPVLTHMGAFGLAPGTGGAAANVQVLGVTDVQKARSIVAETCKDASLAPALGAVIAPGSTVTFDLKPGAAAIDGVEYDEIAVKIAASATASPADKATVDKLAKMYAEPTLIAYPPGAMVMTSGAGSRAALEKALAGYKAGASTASAAKALPPNQTFSMAMNFGGMMKAAAAANPELMQGPAAMLAQMPPGKEYITICLKPVGGAAEARLNLAAGALREIAGPMMGGMGPR